jgi:hypothetical protein
MFILRLDMSLSACCVSNELRYVRERAVLCRQCSVTVVVYVYVVYFPCDGVLCRSAIVVVWYSDH